MVLLCSTFSILAYSQEDCADLDRWQYAALDEDALLIGLLRVNGTPLSSGFDIFQHQDTFLVPIQSLSDVLGMAWQVNFVEQAVKSNPTGSKLNCELDIDFNRAGSSNGFFWGQDDFDIYIDINAIPLLLGGSVTFAFDIQQLLILSEIPIPALRRDSAVEVPSFTAMETIEADQIVVDQYWLATPPLLNYRFTSAYDSEEKELRTNASVNGFFDLAHHATELRVNRTNSGTKQFLRLSKNLDLSSGGSQNSKVRYEIGDLQLQSDELVTRAKQAAGISVFNFDPSYTRSFSEVTIEETVLPGWRAQLFRNGQFIQELFADDTNRVVFEQVDTFYGNNLFEIKLYGPEGQQEVRTQTVNVGREQLTPGKLSYQFNVSDASIRTIDSNLEESSYDQNISGLISYGLNQTTTVEAAAYTLKGTEGRQDYLSSSLYMNFEGMAVKTQVVKDVDNGAALFAGVNANFAGLFRANLTTRYFDDFTSDAYEADRDIRSESRLRLNGRSDTWGGLGWNASVLHRKFNQREGNATLNVGINKNLLGGTFSSSVTYNSTSEDQKWLHRLYWSKNFSGWQFSNSLEWLPDQDQKVRNYYTNIRWPQKYRIFNESRLDYRANLDDKFSFSHRFNWRRDEFNLQFGTSIDDGGHWRVNFGISGDLEYNPFSKSVDFYRPRGGNVANIHAFAYLDNNRNSIFDDQDESLPDVIISGNQRWRHMPTNEKGMVQLTTTSRRQSLSIDDASLPDPFMRPSQDLVLVDTHKGGLNRIELPVVTFSDIEGSVYLVKGQSSRGGAGIELLFLNEKQAVMARVKTEVDGYFYVSDLAPGTYSIEVDPQYLEQNQLVIANRPEAIVAPVVGDAIRINDLLLVDADYANTTHDKPIEIVKQNKSLFYAQLGAFKKPRSIIEVIKHLPTDKYDLRIYRNHKTALSHVVLGGYETLAQANAAIAAISDDATFVDAFVTNTSRYNSDEWQLEYELQSVAQHIQESHQEVQGAAKQAYFCMLASYRSLTSIDAAKLNDVFDIKVARRMVNGKRYYSLFTGPVNNRGDCQHQSVPQSLSISKPFAISRESLIPQLVLSQDADIQPAN